jgi:hypothetical protein
MTESSSIEPLSLARFQALADAYGGVVARWPAAERAAAAAIAARPEGRSILADALRLDEALDAWRVPAPAVLVRERVLRQAPGPRPAFAVRARLWWSGLGVAAALVGAVAGTAAVAIIGPGDVSIGASTSFGDVAEQES